MTAQVCIFLAVLDEHTGNKHAFCHRPLAGAEGLEALAGFLREAVQIQTVIPVCPSNQGKAMGADMGNRIVKASAQMFL